MLSLILIASLCFLVASLIAGFLDCVKQFEPYTYTITMLLSVYFKWWLQSSGSVHGLHNSIIPALETVP